MHGDGQQTRDFIYVSDIVNGLILGMNALWRGKTHASNIILGTNAETSINDLWKNIAFITKKVDFAQDMVRHDLQIFGECVTIQG